MPKQETFWLEPTMWLRNQPISGAQTLLTQELDLASEARQQIQHPPFSHHLLPLQIFR
jgi:hypothetical protein